MRPRLTLACGDYRLTSALRRGTVQPEGIDLNVVTYPSPERHWRMLRGLEFDACELSLGSYLLSRRHPDEYPFTAIPVFPHRRFRHSYMFVPEGSSAGDPGDFAGGSVGLKNWQNSAGVWMKGIAADQYGLDLSGVTWYCDHSEDIPVEIPDRFDVRPTPGGQTVEELLEAGKLDGAMYPVLLASVKSGRGASRLFDDSLAAERGYYRETGIFPTMHTVVIRDDLLERDSWIAVNLLDAFREAREEALSTLGTWSSAFVWIAQHHEAQVDLLGENPWPYGMVEGNRQALRTMQAYAADQGLIPRIYDAEELFVGTTLLEDERARRAALGAEITRSGEDDIDR